jgi:predicted Fe-Mo cluster-binding NifX family protein
MKIVVSSTGISLDDKTHDLFGRCDFLIIFDMETGDVKAVKNENKDAESGAGIGCAQIVFDEGAQSVISGKVGPKAYEVLQHAGVDVFLAPPGILVSDALEKYKEGRLRKMEITKF